MRTLVRPYPISIDWPNRWAQRTSTAEECRRSVIDEFNLREDARIGVGVDRLDYTKGIEERLLAVERLLETRPEYQGVFTFIQAAAPSRSTIPEYKAMAERYGFKTPGRMITITAGPNAGLRVIYLRNAEGLTIDFLVTGT